MASLSIRAEKSIKTPAAYICHERAPMARLLPISNAELFLQTQALDARGELRIAVILQLR